MRRSRKPLSVVRRIEGSNPSPSAHDGPGRRVRARSLFVVSELTWWYSPHPAWEPGEDWPEDVPVVRYETGDEVVLVDPFLPPDGLFDPHGKSVRVLLTQPAHYRGTADFVERFDSSVWVPPRAEWRKRPSPATTSELPRGIEAIELAG